MSTIQPTGPECGEFAEILPQLWQDAPDPNRAHEADIRAHLGRCAYCRAKLADYDVLDSALRAFADRLASQAPSAAAVLKGIVGASTLPALPLPPEEGLQGEMPAGQFAPQGTASTPPLTPMQRAWPQPRPATRRRPVLAVVAALLLVALAGAVFTTLAQTRQVSIGHKERATATSAPSTIPVAPAAQGRTILVSLSKQRLYAYESGVLAFTFAVVTGPEDQPTPTGETRILLKTDGDRGMDVVSPYPPGSHWWYPTVHVHYWLEFRQRGYSFYDAWWRSDFGPGSLRSSNALKQVAGGPPPTWAISGGVGMGTADAQRLNAWAPIGALVSIRADA